MHYHFKKSNERGNIFKLSHDHYTFRPENADKIRSSIKSISTHKDEEKKLKNKNQLCVCINIKCNKNAEALFFLCASR